MDYRIKQSGADRKYIENLMNEFAKHKEPLKFGCIAFVLLWMPGLQSAGATASGIIYHVQDKQNFQRPRIEDVPVEKDHGKSKEHLLQEYIKMIISYNNPVVGE